MTTTEEAKTVTILYTNYRGETAVRRITPIASEWFGSSEWHPEPQWLFTAFDMDKQVFRDFARSGVKAWGQVAVDAALASPRADSAERTAGEDRKWTVPRAVLVEAVARHFHDEEHEHEGYAWTWPEYADDDGRRGNSGYVSITPPVVQMECRETAERLVRLFEGYVATPTPATPPGVPDSVRAPDDLTREQIRGRAKALLVKNGCKPGDNFAAQNVIELMATIGMSLLTDLPQDRCAYPECGCDADSVCSTALSTHPAGQSAENVHNPSDTSRGLDGEWYCELHPEKTFGHDGCCGAGITSDQRIFVLVNQRRLAEQSVRECHYMYKDLISPAGQSAGSGADKLWGIQEDGGFLWVGPLRADGTVDLVFEMDIRDMGPSAQDQARANARRIVAAVNAAPDSTRTGDEGSDGWLRKAADEIDKIADLWSGDGRTYGKTLAAIFRADADRQSLAARPAAPEAQGAMRQPIETAPKDRSQILLFGVLKDSRAKPSWFIGAWFPIGEHGEGWWVSSCVEVIATEWAPLPAPPVSSGQGGR